MAAAAQNFWFEGKEFNLWTEDQLYGINRETLTQRGLAIRDHVGQDRLPPMPRHPAALVAWIMQMQDLLSGKAQPAAYEEDPNDAQPSSAHGQGGGHGSQQPFRSLTDNEQAHADALNGAKAARQRNQESNIFG